MLASESGNVSKVVSVDCSVAPSGWASSSDFFDLKKRPITPLLRRRRSAGVFFSSLVAEPAISDASSDGSSSLTRSKEERRGADSETSSTNSPTWASSILRPRARETVVPSSSSATRWNCPTSARLSVSSEPTGALGTSSRSNSTACTASIILSWSRASLNISPFMARSSSSLMRSNEEPAKTNGVSIGSASVGMMLRSSGAGSALGLTTRPRPRPPRRPRRRVPVSSSSSAFSPVAIASASTSRSGSARSWLASRCSAAARVAPSVSPFFDLSTTIRSNSASSSKKSVT